MKWEIGGLIKNNYFVRFMDMAMLVESQARDI
jgi:hypothetical protein